MQALKYFYNLHDSIKKEHSEMVALFAYADVKNIMRKAKDTINAQSKD